MVGEGVEGQGLRGLLLTTKTISRHRGRRLHFMFLFHSPAAVRVGLIDDVLERSIADDMSARPTVRRGNTTEPRIVTAVWSNPGQTHASRASWRHGQERIATHCSGRHWAPTDQVECPPGSPCVGSAYVVILSSSTDVDRPVAGSGGIHFHRRRPGLKRVSTVALDRPGIGARSVPPPKIVILSVSFSVCQHKKWSLSRFGDQHTNCARRIILRAGVECEH